MSNTGIAFEQEVARVLRDNGFDVVRAAASKGKLAGMDVDVVATKNTGRTKYEIGIVLMQMKRTKLK